MRYDEPRLVWTRLTYYKAVRTASDSVCLLLQDLLQSCARGGGG
jgi:hypothetical protein